MKLPVTMFIVLTLALATLAQTTARPNIVLIYADDLGYGDLGAFGQKFIRTPNLDRMAREGRKFTDFYASAPVCAPSRASLMTGMHQGHARIRGNNNDRGERVPLRAEDTTIAEVLRQGGYRTGVIGKWGLGEAGTSGVPTRKGFDYFYGYLNQTHAHDYSTDYLFRNEERVSLTAGSYTPDLFENEALEFIRRERAKPFFLYLAATLPHANNELTRRTGNGMEIASDAPYSNEKWTPQQRNYAAMVSRLDATVGAVMAELRAQKLDRQTLVIFTSDNGPQGVGEGGYEQSLFQSNGGFRGIKRELYEGGIRVPLLVWWPGKVRANSTDATPSAQYDLLATLAAVAAVKGPKTDGTSFEPALRGRKMKPAPFLFFEFHEGGFVRAVRAGKWKAVLKGKDGVVELYDLVRDPREARDVASANPRVVAELRAVMLREHAESEDWRDK